MVVLFELLDLKLPARGGECGLRFADAPLSCQHLFDFELIDFKTDIDYGRDIFFQ